MPAVSKQQRKFMGLVHAVQQGKVPASKVSKAAKDTAKQMKKSDVEDFASTDEKGLPKKKSESYIRELAGGALQAAQTMTVMNKTGKKISVATAKNPSYKKKDPSAHKKAKSRWQRIKDKFSKKKDDKKSAPKKQSKSDTDFYKKQYAGESVKEERDYKDEYKKFQSSAKAKKYRAELNQYNRKKGTYGNGDNKDASHKGGKIAGFEAESKNRGRAEKSRLKKENFISKIIDEVIDEYQINEGTKQMTQVYKDLDKKFKTYDHTGIRDFNKVSKYLKTKFNKDSGLPDAIASFYNDYKGGDDMKKNINKLTKYAKKMKGYKKESVKEERDYKDEYKKFQ